MKLATFRDEAGPRLGIVSDDGLIDIARHAPDLPRGMRGLIAGWPACRVRLLALSDRAADLRRDSVEFLAPVPDPEKILAVGLNYADHCAESGIAPPTQQMWFSKMPGCANGPLAPVDLPACSEKLDYEAELVVVIGRACRNVPRDLAREVIFGYCVGNDFSVRDWQMQTSQFLLGKAFDSHAPMGPWITTTDAVADPHALAIRCSVNGEIRQNSNTRHLIFNCYDQISHVSQAMTLRPGDVIFTGTPGGVAAALNPPRWLAHGDVVVTEIEGLGRLSNVVMRASGETRIG